MKTRFLLILALGWAVPQPGLAADLVATAAQPPVQAPKPQITLDQIRRLMTGTWQNLADTRFSRQLNGDGTCVDRYEGDDSATSTGTWTLINGAVLPPALAARKLPAEGVYMTLSEHGDTYLFALVSVDPQTLEMINIDRQQKLTFTRLM